MPLLKGDVGVRIVMCLKQYFDIWIINEPAVVATQHRPEIMIDVMKINVGGELGQLRLHPVCRGES